MKSKLIKKEEEEILNKMPGWIRILKEAYLNAINKEKENGNTKTV